MTFLLFLLFTIFGAKLHRMFSEGLLHFSEHFLLRNCSLKFLEIFYPLRAHFTKARPGAHLITENENVFNFHVNTISLYLSSKTRSQNEAKGNSEMAY